MRQIIVIAFLFLGIHAYTQNGIIRGSVYDAVNGESLPGVSIFIEGTTLGTITDLDGKFNLSIAEGTYALTFSYISYETLVINDVVASAGKVTLLDNIAIREVAVELSEVTITAQAIRNTETALLTMKQKSANVLDGISATNLKKIGDSDAASSMKRITGVSVEGGRYVYVRGLGDRYTKTTLNGVDIPGLDPDRNTLQLDLFPTSIIDNIVVYKTFSPELPADFTGGVIDITTKDFPEQKTGSISLSAAYSPGMHFNSEYLSYNGGKTDFLGFDDGTRDIPATTNIPFFSEVVGNPYGEKGRRYKEILESFNPGMAALKQKSFMNYSLGAAFGDQFLRSKATLGYNFAFSYKNETSFYEGAEYGRYGLSGNPDVYEMDVREFQKGNFGDNYVLMSGLAGFAIKTRHSKYAIDLLHLQNGESRAGIFDYQGSDQGSNFDALQHNLDYSQRSLSNLLISGKHSSRDASWNYEWKLSPTYSVIKDPDIRFSRYQDRNGVYHIGTEVGFPERIWRDLEEINAAGILHVERDFFLRGQKSKLKFGGAYTYKERDYVIRSFALNIRNITLTGNPDELFYPENLWPYEGNLVTRGTTYEARFVPNNPNQYNSSISGAAAYVAADLALFRKVRATFGLRFEKYLQRYTGQDQLGVNVLNKDIVLDDIDVFPSINLIYNYVTDQNLRASYSSTIARPSFKELSYAEIYDPISGRTFVGGLFRDANDVAGIVYWDGNLVSTSIHNFDLRWELFKPGGQMLSLSGFYKKFIKPIEIVQYATQTGAFQPRNVGDAEVFGAEAEIRINTETLIPSLKNFSILFNITLTQSSIELSETEYESKLENARTGESIDKYRSMAGQAPYIFNTGIAYNGGEKGFLKGLEAGLYYNIQGETLEYVGIADRPDIYSVPFHSLNFNANKKLGKEERIQLGVKVDNILNDNKESVFRSYMANDRYFYRLSPGLRFHLRFSYAIF